MKIPPLLATLLPPLLFIGCNSTSPLTIEEHGAPIAQTIGTVPTELKFVSNGHFTPAENVSDHYHFTSGTRGTLALTDTSLLWRYGVGNSANHNPKQIIQLDSIEGVSYHQGYLQLKFADEVHVLRPTLGNPFKNTANHTAQLFELLKNRDVPELVLENPFRPYRSRPVKFERAYHSDYDNASESYHEQVFSDKRHVSDGNGGYVMKVAPIP